MAIHGDAFLEKLRKEAAIVKLDETDVAVVAHYLIDLDTKASRLRLPAENAETAKASFHSLTAERVELLHQLFAGKQRYGAIGYGHRITVFDLSHDEAEMPGVLAEILPPHWATRFNSLSRGLSELRLRPVGWQDFFGVLDGLRERVLYCLKDLRETLSHAKRSQGSGMHLRRAKEWNECGLAFKADLLFPKNSVDEWGYVSESIAVKQSVSELSKRQASAVRFVHLRKAINEFVSAVGNFLNQVPGAMVLASALGKATNTLHRQRIVNQVLKELGANEHLMRLSVVNGFEACAAIRRLHYVFGETESLHAWQNNDLEQRESREFLETINDWASFVFPPRSSYLGDTRVNCDPLDWALRRIRNRLRNNLQSLRRQEVITRMLSDSVIWDGKPGLWIIVDSDHPITAMKSLLLIWDAIWKSFQYSAANPVPAWAANLMWEEIVIALTVENRSLDRQVYRHFKSASLREDPDAGENRLALIPESVPEDVWDQAGIDFWESSNAAASMDKVVSSYVSLFQHVQHIADFIRIPDADELGMSILQEYLNRESKRAEPMLQSTFDAFVEVLNLSSKYDDKDGNLNHVAAIQLFLELKSLVLPHPNEADGPMRLNLTIDEIVEWRDRLIKGLGLVVSAKLFWVSYVFKFRELAI